MAPEAMAEQDERLNRYVTQLKQPRPERPERRPLTVTLAGALLAVTAACWIAQWLWIPLHQDVAFEHGRYVDGYSVGNGIWMFVIVLTIEALVMCVLWAVIAAGVLRRSGTARVAAFIATALMGAELAVRIGAAGTRYEQVAFLVAIATSVLGSALLLLPGARHFYDWRVGRRAA